jgi:hypothetical protein
MREFDTLRANIPPMVVVPGTEGASGARIGGQPVGTNYNLSQSGWTGRLNDPGKLTGTPAAYVSGPWYELLAYYRSQIEWTPWARQDFALTPLAQDVADGKSFAAFHTPWPEVTTTNAGSPILPAWSGSSARVVDIWSSEEIEENMLENLAWNLDFPGSEIAYPADVWTQSYYPKNNPQTIDYKLRFDQIISARYREMVSSSNAPSAQYWGGQMMTIHDTTIGGNSSLSDSIHHVRYVRMTVSNNGKHNLEDPQNGGAASYNNLKLGFFIPSSIDTLSVGINKIESDAEWSTIVRRGASR